MSGGIIYINTLDGTLLIQNSQFVNFSAPYYGLGSMLYSVASSTTFQIQDSHVQCQNTFDSTVVTASLTTLTSAYAGAIYFEKSTIGMTSLRNVYQYCYNINNGAVIYI